MSPRELHILGVAICSAIVSGTAWAIAIASNSDWGLVLTLILHVAGAGVTCALIATPHRSLALALGVTVPVLGPVAAALSSLVTGLGGGELLHDPHAATPRIGGSEMAHRLTSSLPVCEALASSDVEARRQALTKLTNRATPDDIASLRWAHTRGGGDAAVEVALAFEEMGARFEQRATAARLAATIAPSFASLARLFGILADGITSGVVDASLVVCIAAEACRHHDDALALDPSRRHELLGRRARLALAVHRPSEAFEHLTRPGVDIADDTELHALFLEAAYATRRFDLAPGPVNAHN